MDLKMSNAVFAVCLIALGGLGAVMGAGVLLIVPRIEAHERRRSAAAAHPAE